jgi:ribosome-binding protein aMBF1 (putative translation factor)
MKPQTVQDLEAAFRRAVSRCKESEQSAAVQSARNALRRKGWSQADLAKRLGISPIHLCYVLNGRRESRRIINEIQHLPDNPSPA